MNQKQHQQKKHSAVFQIYDFVELLIISICIVLLFFNFGARLCRVSGDSMLNTLHDGELLLVYNTPSDLKRGDIVVFHQTSKNTPRLNEAIVKRVIATEGEYVYVDYNTGTVYVSCDETFDESDIVEEAYDYINNSQGIITSPQHAKDKTYLVPDNCIFVLGDNRNESLDSRSDEIGFVDTRRVLGKVAFRVAPVSKFGKVD